jgi:PIN domain nuclease of toxin-antitoxin system
MRLILDTHIFLWSLLEPQKLALNVAEQLQNTENELWLSPITIWETMILAEKKRIALKESADKWLEKVLKKVPFRQAPITHDVAIKSRVVELNHQDPADRFLVATACLFDLTLITADELILKAKPCRLLANI